MALAQRHTSFLIVLGCFISSLVTHCHWETGKNVVVKEQEVLAFLAGLEDSFDQYSTLLI